MKNITIPDNLTQEEKLVVIPRRDYEQLVSDSSEGYSGKSFLEKFL